MRGLAPCACASQGLPLPDAASRLCPPPARALAAEAARRPARHNMLAVECQECSCCKNMIINMLCPRNRAANTVGAARWRRRHVPHRRRVHAKDAAQRADSAVAALYKLYGEHSCACSRCCGSRGSTCGQDMPACPWACCNMFVSRVHVQHSHSLAHCCCILYMLDSTPLHARCKWHADTESLTAAYGVVSSAAHAGARHRRCGGGNAAGGSRVSGTQHRLRRELSAALPRADGSREVAVAIP